MKEATIKKVDNGYLITITYEGNQTPYNDVKYYVAPDLDEALDIIRKNN